MPRILRYPRFNAGLLLLGVLGAQISPAEDAQAGKPQVFEVDRSGPGPYKTLASVAKLLRPGDTLKIKPGSGPYRETLDIRVSGTEQNPIVIDGEDNVITGFDVITDWQEKDGVISCHLKEFPCVLAYRGERLVQDASTGQFTKYADLNPTKDTLTLRPGTEKTGWEISKRQSPVQINNVSHHLYKNVRASGGANDGFNLHGTGTGLRFENIEGFQNLDEGFSSHDGIVCEIRSGKFWGNDNGITNSYTPKKGGSFDVVSSIIENTDVYDNLGFGLSLHDCSGSLKNVRIWHNGLRQLRFNKVVVTCEDVSVYTTKHTTRQLISYKDSQDTTQMFSYSFGETEVKGTPPVMKETDAP